MDPSHALTVHDLAGNTVLTLSKQECVGQQTFCRKDSSQLVEQQVNVDSLARAQVVQKRAFRYYAYSANGAVYKHPAQKTPTTIIHLVSSFSSVWFGQSSSGLRDPLELPSCTPGHQHEETMPNSMTMRSRDLDCPSLSPTFSCFQVCCVPAIMLLVWQIIMI